MNTELCLFQKKYTEMMRMRHFSPRTIECYLSQWKLFKAFKNSVHETRLTSTDIQDYLIFLNTKNVSDSYFNQAINAIRFMFKHVFNRKIKDYMVVRPKKVHTQPIILDYDEIQAMFNACKNLKHLAILSLLYSAALRVSEIINLKITDIDSRQMIIRIRSAKGRKDRLVPLAPEILEVLRKYYKKYTPTDYLFYGQNKNEQPREQYTAHSIQLWIKKLAFTAGIDKKVYPHLIRHTSITHSLEGGVDIRTLQIIAGHQNIKTTLGYTHSSPKFIASIKTPMRNIIGLNRKSYVNSSVNKKVK